MKNFFLGSLIGAAVTLAIIWFGIVPGTKQTAYESGYSAGNAAGIDAGTQAGLVKGIEQVRQQEQQDSLRMDELNRKALDAAAAQRQRRRPQPVQNWHVIDGRIADPITRDAEPDL